MRGAAATRDLLQVLTVTPHLGRRFSPAEDRPQLKYPKREQAQAFVEELLTSHRALPGVQAAAAASATPLGGHSGVFFEIEHAPPKRESGPNPVILLRTVTPGYLQAVGMTLRSGRAFTSDDGRSPRHWLTRPSPS